MQAIGRQPQRAPDGAPVHYERHRPEQTTLYRLVQQHAASFIAHTEAGTGAELPRFIKDEFDAFLECGILAHGFVRLRCGECGHDKLLAFRSWSGLGSGLGSDGGRLNFLSPPAIERGEPGVVTHGRRQKRARPSPTK